MLLNNRYRIIRTLGSGGFGETFLAEDTQIPSIRQCVIKQLRVIQDNPQTYEIVRQRFAREAAILEELGDGSPQIPRLYAYFNEGQRFYLAQEYIQGQTLSETIGSRGRLNESEVRQILISLLKLLDYVHSKGIVHRDIKPDNIIIRSSDNQPVLIDFGAVRESMAAQVNSQGNVTSSIVIGTPGFMSMEQAAGRAIFASDIYSLGLVGIYLLTAKLPQEWETDSYSGEIIWQKNGVSQNFAAVLDKAIRSHPKERFSSANEMLNALQFQPTVQMIPPVQSRPKNIQPKNTGSWLKSAFIGALMGGVALFAFALIRGQQSQTNPPDIITSETAKPIITQTQTATTPAVKSPISFYFLADSAFREINNANNQIRDLRNAGYKQALKFWLLNYPNLYNKPYHQVYVDKFNSRSSCIESLKNFVRRNKDAYCALASENANTSPNSYYGSQLVSSENNSRPLPAQAIRNYYTTINNNDYRTAWNQLTPKFKREKSNNDYSEYVNWWNTVERVEIDQVNTLSATSDTANVEVKLKYRMKDGRVSPNSHTFKLVWNLTQKSWNFDDSESPN